MDEYLSEKEQLERIHEWWREYGAYLLGGVAAGALALFGWNRWGAWEEQRAIEASALYQELRAAVLDRAVLEADDLLAELRADYSGSPYTDQAAMLVASLHLDQQDTDAALTELRSVVESTNDPDLAMLARLRAARLYLHLERYEDALSMLDRFTDTRFVARASELRGDVLLARGDVDGARAAYQLAFNAEYTDVLDRNLLQMKLDELASAPSSQMAPATAPERDSGTPAPNVAGEAAP